MCLWFSPVHCIIIIVDILSHVDIVKYDDEFPAEHESLLYSFVDDC